MKSKLRKGLQDIRTRSSLTGDAENPQRKFLRVASLELKKSLCGKVRDAARKRSEEMDRKIAELDGEKAQLLASSQVAAAGETDPRRPESNRRAGVAGTARLRLEVLTMTTKELPARRPALVEAQAVVRTFLQEALPDVHRVDITKLIRIEFNEGGWEADAAVWQPNATIHALGLSTERPVLDRNFYVVRLDAQLDVIGYEIKEAESTS